jgi:hypothetical protein
MGHAAIPTILVPPGRFSTFNREERNAVAYLYAALLIPANLERFSHLVGWDAALDDAELFVEWTFLRDLWNTHLGQPELRREAILQALAPSNRAHLERCSIEEFNRFFIPSGRVSASDIQSPGRWSVTGLDERINDDDEFRRTCMFKWAFNIKPDLVVDDGRGRLLCIEAKWESSEGSYPTSGAEKAAFARRGCARVGQAELQHYLVEELLGFTGTFRYLDRRGSGGGLTHTSVSWREALGVLDLTPLPGFVQAGPPP